MRLARQVYGLTATARTLPSYLDQNFLLETADGARYVLKIANAAEDAAVLDFQQAALTHLAAHDLPLRTPRVQPACDGARRTRIRGHDGATHWMWMVSYLPGTFMADVVPHTPDLLRSLGVALGRLDGALAGFSHPAMHRPLIWDMQQYARLPAFFDDLADPAQRALVEDTYRQFEATAAPLLPGLRRSVVHNDGNDHNVLVGAAAGSGYRVDGLIDFGDLVHTFTVAEPAIAATYAMLGKPDLLAAASHVVGGYHAAYPLTEQELAGLFWLIRLRLCASVCMSARHRRQNPSDAYLAVSEAPAWDALQRLAGVHPHWAEAVFRHACGLEPCPRTDAIVAWLRRQAGGAVVEPPLTPENTLVFDFSVGSPDLDPTLFDDAEALSTALFGRMQAAGRAVGVGRYDEARLWYTSPLFAGEDGGPSRTVHLGIDLFLPAGSPVFAPLDGTVHSFRNNDGPLDYGPTVILEHPAGEPDTTFFTLYGHLSRATLDGLYPGMPVRKGDRIGTLGEASENGGWPPHLHFQLICDLLGNEGDFPGVCAADERACRRSFSPDPNLLLCMDHLPPAGRSVETLRALRARHLGPSLSLSYDVPLHIVRGRGAYLYDADGRAYLDCVNNVCHVGHCHPKVVTAACRQMATLNTNTRYLHDAIIDYAQRLTATLPDPLRVCFFVNSGSEANDLALRLARAHTGRAGVVVVDGAYHGNLSALIDLSPYKFDGPGGQGAPPHVRTVPMPDPYRGPYRYGNPDAGPKYAAAVGAAVAGGDVGAFFCESLLSCGGQIVLPAGYLASAYAHVRAAGGVCVADEVQVGFGRVGTHFWGFQTQGVVPDIVTMGKPIGNGHPMAAVVTTPDIAASFANGMEYFNTFGGNPVSCAVGLAVLEVIEAEGLQENARSVGAYLKARLAGLAEHHALIGEVRGMGLFLGVELVRDRTTLEPAAEAAHVFVNRAKERGVLLSTDGPLHNVLKIKPPLVFSTDDADRLADTLDAVLAEG